MKKHIFLINEETYIIYRSETLNGTYKEVNRVNVNRASKITYSDKSLTSGKTYYYKIRGASKYGNVLKVGNYSSVVSCRVA